MVSVAGLRRGSAAWDVLTEGRTRVIDALWVDAALTVDDVDELAGGGDGGGARLDLTLPDPVPSA